MDLNQLDNTGKMRIVQELVPGKQITIAHVIANPDQITFAEKTASIGQGDTSDLGLRVYYQQREVHYKEGDLTWTIEPQQYSRRQWTGTGSQYETIVETAEESPEQMQCLSLGTVSDNKLTCEPVYSGENTNSKKRKRQYYTIKNNASKAKK